MTCRAFLDADRRLWTERIGPANSMMGTEIYDCCGRGPPHQSPEGWPCAKVPATANVSFQDLRFVAGTAIAWTKRDLYAWGSGQAVMRNYVMHTPLILWSAPSDIVSVTAEDRALLILTRDGQLFGAGNRHWGSCTQEEWQSDIVEIRLPKGKRAVHVFLRAYFSDTHLVCTDGSVFRFDDGKASWVLVAPPGGDAIALLEKFTSSSSSSSS